MLYLIGIGLDESGFSWEAYLAIQECDKVYLETYTVEITGDEKKIEAIINLLRPLGIKELIRTGKIAIAREEGKAIAKE